MMAKSNKARGDTIVEVLVALAVMTSVLVGAYVTANRSQITNRASQERSEALKTAEAQLESLKGLLVGGNNAPGVGIPFCVKADNSGFIDLVTTPNPPQQNPFNESLATDKLEYTPGECANRDGRYNVAIRQNPADTYEVLVRWSRIGGGKDQINMYYRTYP